MGQRADIGIGELARRSGVNIDTIRYYERIGILPRAARTAGRYRRYCGDDVRRLRFVRRARELGFGLSEVRTLLDLARTHKDACAETRVLATAHLVEVRRKLSDLGRIEGVLDVFVRQCRRTTRNPCPILEALSVDNE